MKTKIKYCIVTGKKEGLYGFSLMGWEALLPKCRNGREINKGRRMKMWGDGCEEIRLNLFEESSVYHRNRVWQELHIAHLTRHVAT